MNMEESEITANWGDWDVNHPLVSVKCLTYNHEKYISQALDSFLMQKTDFPFEIVVHDDASTDSTAKIIREYEKRFPNIVKPIYETENQYSKKDGSLVRIVNSYIKGKYCTFCEGDDFWYDEKKLQKQVNFLEKNPEYGMVYSKARKYYEDRNIYKGEIGTELVDFDRLIVKNKIPTSSVCVRQDLYLKYYDEIKPETRDWKLGDWPIWLWFCINSKIKFFDECTSVYRILRESASHSRDIEKYIAFKKSVNDVRNFYRMTYFNKSEIPFPENSLRGHYIIRYGKRREALKYLKKSEVHSKKERIYVAICSNIVSYWILLLYYCLRSGYKRA